MGLRRPILLTCLASAAILALGGYYFASREVAKGAREGVLTRSFQHVIDMSILTKDGVQKDISHFAKVDSGFVCHDSALFWLELKPKCDTRSLDNVFATASDNYFIQLFASDTDELYYALPKDVQIKCGGKYIHYFDYERLDTTSSC